LCIRCASTRNWGGHSRELCHQLSANRGPGERLPAESLPADSWGFSPCALPLPRQPCTIKFTRMKALLDSLKPGDKDWDLAHAIDSKKLPAHIAIIMDGNGRWANRRRLPRVAGHRAGVGPVRTTVETCARMGIEALT